MEEKACRYRALWVVGSRRGGGQQIDGNSINGKDHKLGSVCYAKDLSFIQYVNKEPGKGF